MILKATLSILSGIVTLIFGCKLVIVVLTDKLREIKSLPFESAGIAFLLVLLVWFNDPLCYTHVYYPSFWTYALSEFGIAQFSSALLIFWLRDIARYRARELPPDASKAQKFLHASMKMNKCILFCLAILYFAMVLSFMALYCVFYKSVEGEPGSAEISVN